MLATGWRCLHYNIIETAKLINLHARTLTMSFRKSKEALCQTFRDIKQTLQHTTLDGHRQKEDHFQTLTRCRNALN